MFFGKADKVVDFEWRAIVKDGMSIIASEHLMHFAEDDSQVRCGGAIFEGREGQVEAIFVVGEMPGVHIIAGLIAELDFVQFVDASIQDDAIFGRFA